MIFQSEQKVIPEVKPLLKKFRRKREPLTKKERLVILGIFLTTAVLSLFFYLKPEIPKITRELTSPLVITGGKQIESIKSFDPSLVLAEIESLVKDRRGTYGVYVYRFTDDKEYGFNQNEVFPAASLMKLPVMLLVYQEAEKGNLKLADYRELVKAMGKRSDNAAYNKLVKYFGQARIQEVIEDLGMKKTALLKDDTTPVDIGLFWRKLYQGKLLTEEHKEEFLSFLTDTIFEEKIPAGLPEGIRVAHKIGTELGAYSDAGIVFGKKPFVLVIMSKEARESEVKEIMPKITKAVWDFENNP